MGWVLVLYVSANKPGKRAAAGPFFIGRRSEHRVFVRRRRRHLLVHVPVLGNFPLIVYPVNIHAGGTAILGIILVLNVDIHQIAIYRAAVNSGAVLRIIDKQLRKIRQERGAAIADKRIMLLILLGNYCFSHIGIVTIKKSVIQCLHHI